MSDNDETNFRSLPDFDEAQQVDLLRIAARLMTLWMMAGKTGVPEGFGTLLNYAMHCAITAYDYMVDIDYAETPEGDV